MRTSFDRPPTTDVAAIYPTETRRRLAAVKQQYDPAQRVRGQPQRPPELTPRTRRTAAPPDGWGRRSVGSRASGGVGRRAADLVRLGQHGPGVGHRTDVAELVRVEHGADRLDPAVEDVERSRCSATRPSRSRKIAPGWPLTLVRLDRRRRSRRTTAGSCASTRSHVVGAEIAPLPHCGALPPPSPTICTSAASSSRSPSTSPSRSASKNRAASSSRSRRSASNRGRPASMCRRARTASWRQAASERPTAAAISREAEGEHLAQHEHRPLERAQPLEQQQGRHRHRVGQLRRRAPDPRTGPRPAARGTTGRRTPPAGRGPSAARRSRSG